MPERFRRAIAGCPPDTNWPPEVHRQDRRQAGFHDLFFWTISLAGGMVKSYPCRFQRRMPGRTVPAKRLFIASPSHRVGGRQELPQAKSSTVRFPTDRQVITLTLCRIKVCRICQITGSSAGGSDPVEFRACEEGFQQFPSRMQQDRGFPQTIITERGPATAPAARGFRRGQSRGEFEGRYRLISPR